MKSASLPSAMCANAFHRRHDTGAYSGRSQGDITTHAVQCDPMQSCSAFVETMASKEHVTRLCVDPLVISTEKNPGVVLSMEPATCRASNIVCFHDEYTEQHIWQPDGIQFRHLTKSGIERNPNDTSARDSRYPGRSAHVMIGSITKRQQLAINDIPVLLFPITSTSPLTSGNATSHRPVSLDMAPPSSPPAIIILRIKVPPGSVAANGHDVFDLGEVPTTASVGRLRQNIEHALPSHPAPANQRLLYAGRALVDNDQTIAEALNTRRDPSQTEYVVHLLVKGDGNHHPPNAETGPSPVNGLRPGTQHASMLSTTLPPPGMSPSIPQPPNNFNSHHMAHAQAHARALAQHQARHLAQQEAVMQAASLNAGVNPPQPPSHVHQMHPQQSLLHPVPPGFTGRVNPPGLTNPPGAGDAQQVNAASSAIPSTTESAGSQPAPQAVTQVSAALPAPPGLPQAPQHSPLRPISGQGFHLQGIGPNGQHFQIHQHTLNFPGGVDPQRLATLMGRPAAPGAGIPSALERARENMVEMQRMLNEMRNEAATSEGQRQRIENMEERAQNLHSYIDPLRLGTTPGVRNGRNSAPPAAHTPSVPLPVPVLNTANNAHRHVWAPLGQTMPIRPPQQAADVTCYLLSSPHGPQALLFSPEHGRYHGHLQNQQSPLNVTPTDVQAPPPPTPAANNAQQNLQLARPNPAGDAAANQPPDAVAAAVAQQAQARAAEAADPLQALLGHFWLLLRMLVFAYFLLGNNPGWRRPLALALIGLGFWMVRMGLFGEGGVARRWWDGIVAVRAVPVANANGLDGEDTRQAPPPAQHAAAAFPTPEQVAQRLLDARNEPNRNRLQRLRELVRPAERVLALFLASLWPGIGEERVRLQEAEERRAREEEVARNRRAVEAHEAESQKKKDGEEGGGEAGGKESGEESVVAAQGQAGRGKMEDAVMDESTGASESEGRTGSAAS
nr:hypothetical protein CFP56_54893 [Quercus suber]